MNIKKDWTGNSRSTITTIGAHNFSTHKREALDYYATSPEATEAAKSSGRQQKRHITYYKSTLSKHKLSNETQ